MKRMRLVQLDQGLRVVVLKKPYDNWHEELMGSMFVKMVALKLQGYLSKHLYGTLPVDTTDFIADHVMICRVKGDELEPLSAFKTITDACCRAHNLPFHAEGVLRSSGAGEHLEALREVVDSARKKGVDIAYVSSWTIAPEIRRERSLAVEIKRIIPALVAQHHGECGVGELIACGAPRLGTDSYNHSIGFECLRHNGTELGAFSQSSLLGEAAVMMHLKGFSDKTLEMVSRYSDLWRGRLVIGREAVDERKAA